MVLAERQFFKADLALGMAKREGFRINTSGHKRGMGHVELYHEKPRTTAHEDAVSSLQGTIVQINTAGTGKAIGKNERLTYGFDSKHPQRPFTARFPMSKANWLKLMQKHGVIPA